MFQNAVRQRMTEVGRGWARHALGADTVARLPAVSDALLALLRDGATVARDRTDDVLLAADAISAGYWADRARRRGSATLGELARHLNVSVQALRLMIRLAIADSEGLLESGTDGLPVTLTEAMRRLATDYSASAEKAGGAV